MFMILFDLLIIDFFKLNIIGVELCFEVWLMYVLIFSLNNIKIDNVF